MPQQHPAEEGFGIKMEWLYFYCVQSCSFERFNYSRVDWLHEQIVRRVTSLYLIWFFIESGISTSCPIPHTHTHKLSHLTTTIIWMWVQLCTIVLLTSVFVPQLLKHSSTAVPLEPDLLRVMEAVEKTGVKELSHEASQAFRLLLTQVGPCTHARFLQFITTICAHLNISSHRLEWLIRKGIESGRLFDSWQQHL